MATMTLEPIKGDTGMRARVEKISPDLARKWLEVSEGERQRGVRRNRVEKLAHAITAGQWQVTHQGIALSPDGIVLDGQHRLHAIILADTTVEMLVMRQVSPDVFHSIDTGASRTPSDTLKIAGHTNTNILAAVVRTILVYEQVVGTQASDWQTLDRQVTSTDILEYLEDHDRREAAYAALANGRMVAQAVSRFGATTPLSAANLIMRTFPTDIGPDALSEFNARLIDGVMLPARSPVLALRRWLVSDTGYVKLTSTTRRPSAVSCYIKAINDYALGVERALSIFRFGQELIPAPLPKGGRNKFLKAKEKELTDREAVDSVTGGGKKKKS